MALVLIGGVVVRPVHFIMVMMLCCRFIGIMIKND